MKAVVQYEYKPNGVKVESNYPEPVVGPGLVKIKVVRAGVCGSDIHQWRATLSGMRINTPVVLGHEFSGIVEEVGEGCTLGYKPGDRVVAENGYGVCGTCEYCRAGYHNMCISRRVLGYWYDGTFAEYLVIPEKNILKIPDNVSFDEAALTEPLACICHACFDQTVIKANDLVVVMGPGPIGQLCAMVARSFGARTVVTGLDRDQNRLNKAKELGSQYVVNIEKEDLSELVMSLTNGYGADVVIDCSGSRDAVNTGIKICRKRGYYTQFGLVGHEPISFDMETVMFREINLHASMGCITYDWRKALALISEGKVNAKALASEPYSLYDFEKVMEIAESRQAYKLIFDPSLDEPVLK